MVVAAARRRSTLTGTGGPLETGARAQNCLIKFHAPPPHACRVRLRAQLPELEEGYRPLLSWEWAEKGIRRGEGTLV